MRLVRNPAPLVLSKERGGGEVFPAPTRYEADFATVRANAGTVTARVTCMA